ncbi:hypothetical protein CAEBREN_16371 [Caenorhabditis brenneri]|uniref:Uncharacterized protein n=1 Tax=Caenorhabditis brenneri TaxID=135651 RepID=G0N1E6_CAEBE|nr:hypothetical protein CAEBREN_16371 [Caenorhabditis brenneri]
MKKEEKDYWRERFSKVTIIGVIGFRNNWKDEEDITTVVKVIALTCIYIFGLALSVLIVSKKVREKYFKLYSFLAILHIFLILFIVFYSFQTFVPGPRTEKLVEVFKFSLYATFIWIPALIISLFSCAILLWKASDQSELYTVILDGKRSSTKLMDP